MKAVVAAINQEKVLVGAFSVITNLRMELFEALDCRYLPYTVEDITVRKYSDIDIRHQDVVEPPLLLIPEEGVGHPNFSSISHCQVFYSTCKKTPLSIRTFCLWRVDLPLHHLLTLTMLFIHCKTVPEKPDNR